MRLEKKNIHMNKIVKSETVIFYRKINLKDF